MAYQLKFFGEMIRTIVIAATRNSHRQSISTMICHNKQISASLRGGIRTASMNRSIFCKEQIRSIQRQIAINLIGRNLMITSNSIFTTSIHQHCSTLDISLQENTRILNRTIHVAFRSKVNITKISNII